jgi:hypothetical protein
VVKAMPWIIWGAGLSSVFLRSLRKDNGEFGGGASMTPMVMKRGFN